MRKNADKKQVQYLRSVKRKLNMPNEVKERVMADLVCSMEERREAGQTEEMIYAELGTPTQVAADLNEQMQEFTYIKSPWRWACLALTVISGIVLAFGGILETFTFLFNKAINSSIGIIGGADGPTAIFVTTSPDATLYQVGICLLLMIMGLLGFFALRRCPRNKNEPQD